MLLAGDIGGTKTILAIFSGESGPHTPLAHVKAHSGDYPSLQMIVKEFLQKTQQSVDRACFAVAGPVIDGRVKTTNLPWMIEEDSLAAELQLKRGSVRLINDLESVARAVPILRASDVETINQGEPVTKGAIGVIAPGTGLGESFLTWDGSRYRAQSSEGGHADFAPADLRQTRLLEYMLKKFDHVSSERVCSGIGIPNIYTFLRDVEGIPEEPQLAELVESAPDKAAVIVDHAHGSENPSKLCVATIDLFVSILAAEAGNLALKIMATGGVYLAGGVALHTLAALKQPLFLEAFRRKGRMADLMARIPLHAIVSSAGLTGAAACGLET